MSQCKIGIRRRASEDTFQHRSSTIQSLEQVFVTEATTLVAFPEGDRPVLGFEETLAEKNMCKDILRVQEPMVLKLQLDELGRSRLVTTGDLMVSQPELVVGHRVRG
jgi:hypothetical protein